ncbi:hypothetical protein JXA32_10715 [Candidatus Sumerlaeota bacterium]|nr:hypothetical protein [Candidatus Sumerlaeota bacterium]
MCKSLKVWNPRRNVCNRPAPQSIHTQKGSNDQYFDGDNLRSKVSFDVAITAMDQNKVKGGIGVVAAVFGAAAQAENETQNAQISRLRFEVTIQYPCTKE